jgi:hypothetical protein
VPLPEEQKTSFRKYLFESADRVSEFFLSLIKKSDILEFINELAPYYAAVDDAEQEQEY